MITCRSSYCPFDLFSGAETRMKSALKGLLKSPQNNLKIFKDGVIVYDQESNSSDLECVLTEWFCNSINFTNKGYIDKFCNLICTVLLRPFISEEFKFCTFPTYELCTSIVEQDSKTTTYINPDLIAKAKKLLYFTGEMCNLKEGILPNNSVLERILHMQRLPFISSEYVYNTYLKFRSWLTDEIVYSNLINTIKYDEYRISYLKQNKSLNQVESPQTLKQVHIQTCAKNTNNNTNKSKVNDDYISNKHINESNENFLISKSILIPIEKNNFRYNNVMNSENNVHYNEKETYFYVNTESILCLQNYLLFSCARDCSILMSFRETNSNTVSPTINDNIVQLPDGLSFVYNIRISDIDPKSLHCIEKHCQRDIDVLNSVISFLEQEFVIKNQNSFDK
ncbi:hypothetical protein K0M31_001943 [Melipona bicolor]|uniref:Inositol-pentakisphosphate 2-kinase n=1 Tax=Melipona bicolor TaxID=60889 RepID=A0AA40KYD4_9HYME|nr:hypothetical protein K0M31_001943 [Melipona bicolor]